MRIILLGPQRRPTLDAAVRSLGLPGPFATVTAGWQEREPDDRELSALLGGRDVNMELYRRWLDVQDRDPDAGEYVSAAKAFLGIYGPELAHDCVQMHGGIGVTFDHDLHLYLRRVVLGAKTYGTVSDHRARITDILEKKELASV